MRLKKNESIAVLLLARVVGHVGIAASWKNLPDSRKHIVSCNVMSAVMSLFSEQF